MMNFALAAVPLGMKVVVGIWLLVSLVLILVVLIQKGRGGGLSSAFGGIGNSLLGTKTGDFLTWFTICLVAFWLILSVVAAKWFRPRTSEYLQSQTPVTAPATQEQPALPAESEQPAQPETPAEVPQPNTPAN